LLNKLKVVEIPTHLKNKQSGYFRKAQIIPLVSGVFGTIDTLATLSNKLGHFFDTGKYKYKRPKEGDRTFADLMIMAMGEGTFIGQNEDAAQNSETYVGKSVNQLEKDSWMKSAGLWAHERLLTFHDYRAKKIAKGGWDGAVVEGVDRAMDFTGYAITKPMSLGVSTLSLVAEKSIKEYETYPRNFGTDPTHTQVNKDDPSHPINDLAGILAVEAVKRVGKKVYEIRFGKGAYDELVDIIDDIMSHPCRSTWMDKTVKNWAAKYPSRVESLEESSYIEIAQKIYKKQKSDFDQFSEKVNGKLLEYEKE